MASVDWRHSGRRLILPVVILPPPDAANPHVAQRTIDLLDTGATGTGIHPAIVDELRLERKGQRRIATANGIFMASEIMLRIGFIAGDHADPSFLVDQQLPYVLERSIIAFELQRSFDYAVLIGMDVISQCDLHVRRDGTASLALP